MDHCEEHPQEATAINRDGALHVARAAREAGAGFVFYSSEYVFDGTGGPYAEDDPARPLSEYGRSKWEGERAVLAEIPRAIVIRTTVVYGPDRQEKNFVYQLIRNCRGGQPMRVASDQISSPTYNVDLALATVELCERDARGVYHLAGERHPRSLRVCAARVRGLRARLLARDPGGDVVVWPEGRAPPQCRAPHRQGPGAARDAAAIARSGPSRDARGHRERGLNRPYASAPPTIAPTTSGPTWAWRAASSSRRRT